MDNSMLEYCNRIWKGGGWSGGWREGAIVPIRKKEEGERVEDYRGVMLMPSLYRVSQKF